MGTLLYAFHRYSSRLDKTAFVGVHTGHLGSMLIGYLKKLKNWLLPLPKTPYQVVEYPLLEVIIHTQHGGRRINLLGIK